MVSTNGGTTTLLKARFGNDIRRRSIHHAHDLTLNDLVLMLQRVFSISNNNDIQLKYRDSDGDFITIADDTDLLLALQEPTLFIDVVIGAESGASDLFVHIKQLQEDLGKLTLMATKLATSNAGGEKVHLSDSFNAPPSPVPTEEKSERPATIQPSRHEEVNSSHYDQGLTSRTDVTAPLEQEIPLEADGHDSFGSHVPDPHVHFGAPPAASIPQFPMSNAPIHPEAQYGMHGGYENAPLQHPPQQQQQQQPHTPHSSVSSTPIPQQQQQQFGHPGLPQQPQFNHPGFTQQQQFAHPGFAPPPPQGQFAQPQGFAPPPTPGQAPSQQGPQGFAPPPTPQQQHQGFAPPPSMNNAPAPPAQQNFGPPGQQSFAPPPQFGNPQQQHFNPPSEPAPPQFGGAQNFAPPPPMGGPPMGAPSMSGPPPMGGMGGPPMGGMAGGNPFARGPGAPFRQSPYHQ